MIKQKNKVESRVSLNMNAMMLYFLHTFSMSVVIINSDSLVSLCLLGGRVGPSPKIAFTLSFTLSLGGCLFMAQPEGVKIAQSGTDHHLTN